MHLTQSSSCDNKLEISGVHVTIVWFLASLSCGMELWNETIVYDSS